VVLEKIGRYEILGQLGRGAMGVVYKALDPTIGRTVALKTMRLDVEGPETSELLQRFRTEARLAGVLNHPNIVTIYDADEINGLFYMAMEYIEGKTLHQLLLQERVLSTERVLDLSRQICAGLDAASAQRVVHRDIKPANIMILPGGMVKIMDFGIAKAGGGMTSTGEVLGTPTYMSPEQVKGHLLDGRSDLFSFGVILYEMVTGAKPFVGDNIAAILYKIVNEEPIPLQELNPAIHRGLICVILKALAKAPPDRYQLGSDLVKALENYESIPPGAKHTSSVFPKESTPANVKQPERARKGVLTSGEVVMSRVSGKKPLMTQKSIPPLPLMAAVLAIIVVVVSGVVSLMKHEQAKQRVAEKQLLQQKSAEQAAKTPPSPLPEGTAIPTPLPTPMPLGEASSNQPVLRPSGPTSSAGALGELVLSTDPDGAEVKIDGASQSGQQTPFTATAVSPGPHTVTFSKNGYTAETRVVEVHAGRQEFLRAFMKTISLTATASISSDPAGAAILIDDKEIANVTPTQVVLSPGAHRIAVRKGGFEEATTDIDSQEGQMYNFAPTLKPMGPAKDTHSNFFSRFFSGGGNKVLVEMHSDPRGAEILVNGQPYSKTTPAEISLPPGEYQITFQLPDYKPSHRTLVVEKGPVIHIEETLQK